MSPSTPYHINHLDEDHVDDGDDDTEAQDDDDDELSTASGRRHGAILQPEEADMILFESPYMTQWTQRGIRQVAIPNQETTEIYPIGACENDYALSLLRLSCV